MITGGGLPVSLCDYLFPGDTPADACQSALELLDVTVSEENVDSSLELLAGRYLKFLELGKILISNRLSSFF